MKIFNCLILALTCISISVIAKTSIPDRKIFEVVIFTCKNNIASNKVKNLAKQITPILKTYPGYISRTIAQNTKYPLEWIDVVQWENITDANFAAKNIVKKQQMKKFIGLMRHYKMYHFTTQ